MSKQTYASPMSFVGATRRLTAWARAHRWWGWTLVLLALPFAYAGLLAWYVIVLGLFGLLTIPFRLIRRSQRKSLAVQQEQLELMRRARDEHLNHDTSDQPRGYTGGHELTQ